MDKHEKKSIKPLIEELASFLVTLDLGSRQGIKDLAEKLESVQRASVELGMLAFSEAVGLLLRLIGLPGHRSESLRDAVFCWIDFVQDACDEQGAYGSLVLNIKKEWQKIFGGVPIEPPQTEVISNLFSFTPTVPVLDLSEGPDILLEFIVESRDHLESAEQSLLALENSPDDPEEINKIFRGFHTIKGVASFLNLEDIRILSHEMETMMDLVRQGALSLNDQVTGSVLSSVDLLRKLLDLLKEQIADKGVLQSPYIDISSALARIHEIVHPFAQPLVPGAGVKKIGDILVEKDIISETDLTLALKRQQEDAQEKKLGEILVNIGAATQGQIERSLSEQKVAVVAGEMIKIAVKKLDDLVDAMGELVITGTQVIHHPVVLSSPDIRLRKDIRQLDRIIRDIQNISMAVRLVPIRPVFQKMVRLLRDLSLKSSKKIEIRLSGEDTEIDKNITELISDPLVHMIRNSVDHGIEPLDVRRAQGKSDGGTVSLDAYHKGGHIMIEVSDDGAGLNKEKILKRGIERGLVQEGEVLPDDKIYRLIFEPGFSTAEKVTDISGRGVGMDVVKRNIEQLRGRVEIETESGKGTKFTLRLPLTLAIIEGIVVKAGSERYILPIFSVVEFIKPQRKDITLVVGRGELIKVHGNIYSVVRLDRHFNVQYHSADIEELTGCMVNSDYGLICVLIDELVGQQQVVIKNLGGYLKDVKGCSGATILGDGRVGLILDVNAIASMAQS